VVRFAALDLKLMRDMWHLRGHLTAVALVAACGAATYVTMRGAYEALVDARTRYYGEYRFADVFAQAKRAPRAMLPRIAALPGVSAVQDRIVHEVMLDLPDFAEPVTALLISLPEAQRPVLNDVFVRSGAYLQPGATDEVLVGESFALAHGLKPGGRLSAVINGRWQRLRVVGVADSPEFVFVIGGASIFPDDKRYGVLWMGRKAMEAGLDMEEAFNDVVLRLAPSTDERGVIDRLDLLLAPYGSRGAYGRAEQISHQMLNGEIQQDRVTGMVVPAIFLGVAAFLIYNVLTRLIGLQRAQIGVLKAFGYTHREVAMHYIKLALGAVLAGCAAGVGLGAWLGNGLANIYQSFFHFPQLEFALSLANVAGVTVVCALAAVAGALPALRRALTLPPAEAMRPEPPPKFRPLLLERLGYAAMFSPAARMLFRNLERRPVRAAVSVLAIALACALLVVGQYGLDAIDETIRVQFRAARRDDVRIAFYEARDPRVRHELQKLPGVLQAEAIRVVTARLEHGHRSKRVVVFGLPPDAQLQRLLDIDMREVPLPPHGLVIGGALARLLEVAPGDSVRVEFLEGERRVRQVPIVSMIEEPIGLYAYMDERALARLMSEGLAYTDAYLRVDRVQIDALYRYLKQLPAVSGVSLREATLQSFLDTIAENFLISTWILIGFACAIAAGVVYNGARLALSEHAITLASLRVLGFTRREVTGILLGEQALVALAAMPVGCTIGYGLCAWLSRLLETELYRLPLTVSLRTYAYASAAIVVASLASGAAVAWRLRRLDLVAVLKSRE
jgi:putative ABC transport system permease protein